MVFTPFCPFAPFAESVPSALEDRPIYYMQCAYNEAIRAWWLGEIPSGAVAVVNNRIVGRAYNQVERQRDPCAHAEIQLIRRLARQRGDWRLTDVTIYVTKEPCPMCSGAIFKARIPRVVLGAYDRRQGCLGGCLHFNALGLYHHVDVSLNDLNGACERLLTTFFKMRRQHGH